MEVPMTGNDIYLSSCFVAQGLISATPWKPKVAFTTPCLEIYRLVHLQCDKDRGVGIERYVIQIQLYSSCRGESIVE
jgi:hypothetical protein